MNFLEQVIAEWYEYNGYFVRTNIKFGPRDKGGYIGEMDVVGYKPETQEFVHIEASTDALSWPERKERFERKFTDARRYYTDIFPFKKIDIKPKQIAVVGFNVNHKSETDFWTSSDPGTLNWGDLSIEVVHIPDLFKEIHNKLKNLDPQKDAIPETYPLLRSIQYSAFYNSR